MQSVYGFKTLMRLYGVMSVTKANSYFLSLAFKALNKVKQLAKYFTIIRQTGFHVGPQVNFKVISSKFTFHVKYFI